MKKKKDVTPQISMDLSDLNFDWEDDDEPVKEEAKKKKSDNREKPHRDASPDKRRLQTDYDLDEVEKKDNEVPIMTFDEINSLGSTKALDAAVIAKKVAMDSAAETETEQAVSDTNESAGTSENAADGNGSDSSVSEISANDTEEAGTTEENAVKDENDESAENASEETAASDQETGETEAADKKEVAEKKDGEEKPKPKKKKKKKEEEEEERPLWKEILELFIYLVVVFIVSYLIVLFVGQRTIVEGSSMNPTLVDGDNLIVDKISYRFSDPERFDVIVFPYQHAKHTYYIKRIIGLPGETVRIDYDGNIYINGQILNESYGNEVIEKPGRASEEILLGPDEYFVMGDNRNNSSDSRDVMVGNVYRDDFIGKAWVRIYPFNKIGLVQHASDDK